MNKIYLLLILIYFFSCDKKKNYTENDVKIAQSLNGTYTSIDTFELYYNDYGGKYNEVYNYQYLGDNFGRFVKITPFGFSNNFCSNYEVRNGVIYTSVKYYVTNYPYCSNKPREQTKNITSIINKKYRKEDTFNRGYYRHCQTCFHH